MDPKIETPPNAAALKGSMGRMKDYIAEQAMREMAANKEGPATHLWRMWIHKEN